MSGSHASPTTTAAVVWGTETSSAPSFAPMASDALRTRSVMSMRSILRVVFTRNSWADAASIVAV